MVTQNIRYLCRNFPSKVDVKTKYLEWRPKLWKYGKYFSRFILFPMIVAINADYMIFERDLQEQRRKLLYSDYREKFSAAYGLIRYQETRLLEDDKFLDYLNDCRPHRPTESSEVQRQHQL